jgi:hypothetical protein
MNKTKDINTIFACYSHVTKYGGQHPIYINIYGFIIAIVVKRSILLPESVAWKP